ncbi:hypothetical protein SAMN05421595_2690 [Austwickia chelonae]|uniref:N-acetyltransferase domain-containing protein n=1 Tax=Austwickia chelonae NBRC 105200 TaxID=1184607 RepID=K6V872_9MICO|nr:hypothetical protein [Austwickia chelonae]GAB78423.1 hypothetical protein AUCHE_09_00290 [Austwickia chelonae NBRC 105200]SEW39386.1 hypothetical protein SAMN05421595_2690 [Austwickia chelonae]
MTEAITSAPPLTFPDHGCPASVVRLCSHHQGQNALWQSGTMKYLIRHDRQEESRREQKRWIDSALVEESFELVIVRDDLGDPVAALDLVHAEDGRFVVTQRALLDSPRNRRLLASAVTRVVDAAAKDVLHARGPVVAAALAQAGWLVAGYAGDDYYVWSSDVVPPEPTVR